MTEDLGVDGDDVDGVEGVGVVAATAIAGPGRALGAGFRGLACGTAVGDWVFVDLASSFVQICLDWPRLVRD